MTPAAAIIAAIEAHESALQALRQALAEIEPQAGGRWLGIKEAAFLCDVSRRQMNRIAPRLGIKVGSQWRICPQRLATFTANGGQRGRSKTQQPALQSEE